MPLIRSFQRAGLGFLIFLILGSPLAFGVTIMGKVVKSDMSALGGAMVVAVDSNTFTILDTASTAADGTFSLMMMPVDTAYQITVIAAGFLFDDPAFTGTSPPTGPEQIGDIAANPSVELTGKVLKSDMTDLSGAFVFAQNPNTFVFYGQAVTASAFSLKLPPSTAYQIIVIASGFLFDSPAASGTSPASGTENVGNIVANPSVELTGEVLKSDMTDLSGAFVFAQNPNPPFDLYGQAMTASPFSLKVPPSTAYEIIVFATGFLFDTPAASGTSPASGTENVGDIVEKASVELTGEVLKSDMTDLSGAFVFAQNPNTFDLYGLAMTASPFSLKVPPSTAYQIIVFASGFLFDTPAASGTSPASGTENVGDIVEKASVELTGEVLKSDMTDLSGAFVFAQNPNSPFELYGQAVTASAFSLKVPPSTAYQIIVFASGFLFDTPAASGTSPASGMENVGNIVEKASVKMEGTLLKPDMTELKGAFVFAQGANPPFTFYGSDITASNFSIPVPPSTQVQIFVSPNSTPGFIFDFPAAATTSPATGTQPLGDLVAKETVTVEGNVFESNGTTEVGGAFVQANDATDPKILLGGDWSLTDTGTGKFSFSVPKGSTFNIFISKTGFTFPAGGPFDATGPSPQNLGNFLASSP